MIRFDFLHLFAFALLISVFGSPAVEAENSSAFDPGKLDQIETAIEEAVAGKKIPGGVFWLERKGEQFSTVVGNRATEPEIEETTIDTIYDVASLTKVIATTTAIAILHERGRLDLEAPVADYLPEFSQHGKERVTVRQLLTHVSGLKPGISLPSNYENAIERAAAERLQSEPGSGFVYSDINFILLGEIMNRVSGKRLDQFSKIEIFEPLGMGDTGFLPDSKDLDRIAPTEKVGGEVLRGVVHDPTARAMGGVAGHAGLFSTASDLARFARMLLNGGELDGKRILKPETIELFTSVQTGDLKDKRGFGWDIDTRYSSPRGSVFPIGSYGHTGWTGPSFWVDPFSETFAIFVNNRNHPSGGDVVPLRRKIATLAAESIVGFDFETLSEIGENRLNRKKSGIVLTGLDILERENFESLRGERIAIVGNHSSINREGVHILDLLKENENVELVALFSPEHGFRGTSDEGVSDGIHEETGLPIYSLYGVTRVPADEMLEGIETVIFDMQDIGARFYTYIATMGEFMKKAEEHEIRFVVLDRPNPIQGNWFDGPIQDEDLVGRFTSFVPMPIAHGMTIGEMAKLYFEFHEIRPKLEVVKMEGWERDMYFDETGLPWVNPSPNMRSVDEELLYTMVALTEGNKDLSVGRGTDRPFEYLGAPWIDGGRLTEEMNSRNLPGLWFMETTFVPAEIDVSGRKNAPYQFTGEICHGFRVMITDRETVSPVAAGIHMLDALLEIHPERYQIDSLRGLLGAKWVMDALREREEPEEIIRRWRHSDEFREFAKQRAKVLLY